MGTTQTSRAGSRLSSPSSANSSNPAHRPGGAACPSDRRHFVRALRSSHGDRGGGVGTRLRYRRVPGAASAPRHRSWRHGLRHRETSALTRSSISNGSTPSRACRRSSTRGASTRSPDRRPRSLKRATCSFEILRKLGWLLLERTDACHDDDGRADYELDCVLLDVPPKRSSTTVN
jgi:hypothetical protein